jgi:hypothetical protein
MGERADIMRVYEVGVGSHSGVNMKSGIHKVTGCTLRTNVVQLLCLFSADSISGFNCCRRVDLSNTRDTRN